VRPPGGTTRTPRPAWAAGPPPADQAGPGESLAPEFAGAASDELIGCRPAGLDTLTPREPEVLTPIAHGRANAEIGAALFLSEPAVKTHVTRILAKLQLRDRVQAVVVAYQSGLIQPGIH
jgi:DNA-binding NarL/FixJ family response regulator